ncbi:hypothetical protein QVD17_33022 [Tagetes erecta]|uniref:Uncharacterized protein n=1 Tax=Tagetes erecta TaxID=13708 RepID=A0AAD8JY02_TARER|nr:hypothetical protein QVD17_33022 [Tagetes erecta]
MEITELNLITDFEAGIKCLQNPSLISKLSSIDKLPKFYSLWTFGALILAIFATFTTVFNRIKKFIHHIWIKLCISCRNSCPKPNFEHDDFDFDFSDDDGDDDTPSSVAESDDEELESNDGENDRVDEVFRADGDDGLTLRRRNGFSWSDFSAGKSVVQLWDSFGLGLDFEDDESEIAIWDLDRDVKISSGGRRQVAPVTENVVLTAEMNENNGGVGFGTYDCRVGETSPAIYAAWRPRRRKVFLTGDGQNE